MVVTHKLNLYLDSWQEPATLDAVQGDTARNIEFSIYAEDALWQIPTGTKVMVRYRKSDNTGGCYDTLPGGSVAYHISNSKLTIHLAPQVLTVAGIVELQIALFNSTQTIAAFSVLIRVQGDPSVGVLESENYVNLSTWIREELDGRMTEALDSGGYLNSKVDDLHSRIMPVFHPGGLENGSGNEISQTTAIRSNLILLGGQELSVTVPAGVKARCFFYDMVGRYTGETEYRNHSFTVYRDAVHVRLVIAYSDDSVVGDPATLAEKVGIFLSINAHDSFRGSVTKHGFASFAQCTQEGYYQFQASDIGMIQDAPAITAGGILEVRCHFSPDAALQTIKTADGEVWFRIGSNAFQKLRSQENEILYVMVWHNGKNWAADKTYEALHDWILSGKTAYCLFDIGDILRLARLDGDGLAFSGMSQGMLYTVTISTDDDVSVTEIKPADVSDIPSLLPNPNKLTLTGAVSTEYDGSKPVEINIPEGADPRVFVNVTENDDGSFSADMTLAQITDAYNQNKMVSCKWGGYTLPLSAISIVSAEFSGFSYDTHYRIMIGNYNGVEKVDIYPIHYAERDSIPTSLPNPYKLTLTGAVKAEYDGSRPVNITIPQSGEGGSGLPIVYNTEITEAVSSFESAVDNNGNPFSLSKFELIVSFPVVRDFQSNGVFYVNDGMPGSMAVHYFNDTSTTCGGISTGDLSGGLCCSISLGANYQIAPKLSYMKEPVTGINIRTFSDTFKIPAGSKICLRGV